MRALKLIGGVVAAALVAVGVSLALVGASGVPHYAVPKLELHVEVTPSRVEHGRLLSGMLCAECHRDPATQVFSGREITDLPRQFGRAWSQNITRDPVDGIGSWSDGELAVIIRTGIHRDSHYSPPWMVKLPNISDEDLASIIAYLRSDAPELAARKGRQPAGQPTLLAKLLFRLVMKPLPLPTGPIATPKLADDKVAFGHYLATGVLGCFACHSKDFSSNNELKPELSAGFFGGGNAMPDINQRIISTANLTPDAETGLGRWSESDFRRALQDGFRPDHRPVRAPMPRYPNLSDDWSDALFAYLRSVPAISNRVVREDAPQLATNASAGERAYRTYACGSCHGDSGLGTYDLRGAGAKYAHDEELIAWIRDAPKQKPGTPMPRWNGVIAESDYQPLADYVRLLGKRAQEQAAGR